jgi:plastocyanin
VTVKAGESVSFTNSDQVSHDLSIKNPDGSRQSSTMQKPGDNLSVTFDKLGSYQVQCLIHPKMKMTVTAQ